MMIPAILFCGCCFFVLFQVVAANVKRAPAWMYDRFFAASETPVLARAIASKKESKSALRTLLSYYEDIDAQMRAAVTPDEYELDPDGADHYFPMFYRWPEMNSTQLVYLPRKPMSFEDVTRYREEKKNFVRRGRSVFQAIAEIAKAMESEVAHKDVQMFIARRKGIVRQWDHVFFKTGTNYTTPAKTHKCEVRLNIAYR